MLGPYIKSRGSRGTKMSANADLITVDTYVQPGETIWKPVFQKYVYFGLFGGNDQKFQGSKTSSQSRHMYNKGKK